MEKQPGPARARRLADRHAPPFLGWCVQTPLVARAYATVPVAEEPLQPPRPGGSDVGGIGTVVV